MNKKMSPEEILDITFKIVKPVHKLLNKKIIEELGRTDNIIANDMITIIILTLVNLTINEFEILKNVYFSQTNNQLDGVKLLISFLKNLLVALPEEEKIRIKEIKDKIIH